MPIDLPMHFHQERVACSIQAADHYRISPLVMLAVAEQEGGKPGQKVRNLNGTYDYGPMQINTVALKDLMPYGITEHQVMAAGCYPYYLAAWRLSGHLNNDSGDLWQRAANFHSRTPSHNRDYRAQLIQRASQIARRLGIKKAFSTGTQLSNISNSSRVKSLKLAKKNQGLTPYSAPIRVKSFDNVLSTGDFNQFDSLVNHSGQ
jgi:hypothetical protein